MLSRSRILLILIFSLFAHAVAAESRSAQIDAMLQLTGLEKLLEHVPGFAGDALAQGRGAIDPEVWQRLQRHLPTAFSAEYVRRSLRNHLRERLEPAAAAAYLDFLRSPLARTFAEQERLAAGSHEGFRQFIDGLPKDFKASSRGRLLVRLDKATRTSLFSVDMQTAFFRAIFRAVDPLLEEDMRLREGELERMASEVRNSLMGPTQEMTLYSFAYAYRQISDGQLRMYVEKYESDSARWGVVTLGEAVMLALEDAGTRLVQEVGTGLSRP